MSVTERHTDRGKAIRQELEERMRWMPTRWRRIVRCRYIMDYSVTRTAMELNIHRNTVLNWTREIAEWLEDTEKVLDSETSKRRSYKRFE